MTTPVLIDHATNRQSLEFDPKLTVSRILEIYLVAKFGNPDAVEADMMAVLLTAEISSLGI